MLDSTGDRRLDEAIQAARKSFVRSLWLGLAGLVAILATRIADANIQTGSGDGLLLIFVGYVAALAMLVVGAGRALFMAGRIGGLFFAGRARKPDA